MGTEVIVLIEDKPDAQRLIVTWQRVCEDYDAALQERAAAGQLPIVLEEGDVWVDPMEMVREHWSRISGVDITDIPRLEPMLFENGLISHDGSVDELVLGWIRRRTIAGMTKPRSAKR